MPVIVPEVFLKPKSCLMLVFGQHDAGINPVVFRFLSGVLLVFVPDTVPGFYQKGPGTPYQTKNTVCFQFLCVLSYFLIEVN